MSDVGTFPPGDFSACFCLQDAGERFPQGIGSPGVGGTNKPGIDVRGSADLRMTQPSGHRRDRHMGGDQQRGV